MTATDTPMVRYTRTIFPSYADSAKTIQKRLKNNMPDNGDIRYLIITERQYQNIVNMNSNYTLQENITTTDRTLIIGGLNSENNT